MSNLINVGNILFNKYLKDVVVTEVNENAIKVKDNNTNIYDYGFDAFGKVLFFKEGHSNLIFKNQNEYFEFARNEEISTIKVVSKLIKETEKVIDSAASELNDEIIGEDDKIKKSKHELLEYLTSKHKFEGFHHYTDFTNFINIMKEGKLSSRNNLVKERFIDAADQEVLTKTPDNIKEYVRFYYKEKTPTFYRNEGIKADNSAPHMPIPVVLLFGENIIFHSGVSFLSGCGGSKYSRMTNDPVEACKFEWKTIFSRGYIDIGYDCYTQDESQINKASIVNKRNAEFLYPERINTKHLKKIIFRSPADLKRAKIELGESDLYELDSQQIKFNYNHNFLHDYEIAILEDQFKIELFFNKPYNDYTHKLRVKYDTKIEDIDIIRVNNAIPVEILEKSNYKYSISFTPSNVKDVKRIDYLMNGHISATWEVKKE